MPGSPPPDATSRLEALCPRAPHTISRHYPENQPSRFPAIIAGCNSKKVIKSSRYLLLANPENLDESGLERLEALRKANEPISTAYQLSEQFRAIYYYKSEGWAKRALFAWCDLADASGLQPFQRLAKGFRKQCSRITSYIKHKVTSGLIEGFNSQISKIIQRACGIANLDYLFLRLRHQSVMRI